MTPNTFRTGFPGTASFRRLRPFAFALAIAAPSWLAAGCTTEVDPKSPGLLPDSTQSGTVAFEILQGFQPGAQSPANRCSFRTPRTTAKSAAGDSLSREESILKTREAFDANVTCNDSNAVDLSRDFVLGGISTPQPSMPNVWKQNVRLKNDTLYYEVDLAESAIAMPGSASYMVKLSRDYADHPVVFKVRWEKNPE